MHTLPAWYALPPFRAEFIRFGGSNYWAVFLLTRTPRLGAHAHARGLHCDTFFRQLLWCQFSYVAAGLVLIFLFL